MCGRRIVLLTTLTMMMALLAPAARAAPSVSFDVSPTTARIGATVAFTASASTDDGATITALNWDFGDGSAGSGASASHAYGSAGTRTVTLTATDSNGATASAQRSELGAPALPSRTTVTVTHTRSPGTAATTNSVDRCSV